MPPIYDLTGKKFGRLTVLYFTPAPTNGKKEGEWTCKCDCGNVVEVLSGNLRSGNTASCGCLKADHNRATWTKHGDAPAGHAEKLYQVYSAIKQRCLNEHHKRYADYGGRGIRLYPAWVNDYSEFRDYILTELGPKPSPVHSLDRINNDGNYEPGNLRWATPTMQCSNQRKRKPRVNQQSNFL